MREISEIFTHRSVRSYTTQPIPEEILTDILEAGARASNTGNMQLYSMIVTTLPSLKERLAPLHFNQPMVRQAPVLITFCADIHRFGLWCRQRGAEPGYDNFLWFVNALTDAMLAAQNVILEAEAHSLGVCFLGTAVYNAAPIAEVLQLPAGVIPVGAICVGYPADEQPLTPRLPLEAVVHRETYRDYAPQDIDRLWAEREASDETRRLKEENGLPNLARIFTERRYKHGDNLHFARSYFDTLRAQGFFNQ
ncbi:MAG: nitroreductase family protein [Rikenellaceae bacterium]|jgi:nitroreductase|nr:nitroreductase family protein [Rikenellaceae bacterium]